ncbi:MAG: ABC transporter ATP-binding protein [Blautia sp.]|uniref:ABC transporter ATP-binding protein n=1 Tax=Blautia sp. TaxID=1955243 RepID=UPI002A764234|nr:ABC transporter ATP-binding protein [Blautia sp.]MDY3017465.1 ABC transporter ATP-binding protein [Blautia sp.]
MKILETKHLKKYYGQGSSLVKAVDDISISVEKGEFVAIVGTSGSGKTSLLNLLGGLDYADSGEVIIGGQSLLNMKDEERTVFRRRNIGFVFQNYNLVSMLNVYKNVVLPIRLDGNKPDEEFIGKLLNLLGLTEKVRNRPNQLSGGQQQRVAIARALASKPKIVLADEPTGNLDSRTSAEVMGLLQMTSREFNQTIIMITHNEEIAQMADRIIHLEDGRVVGGDIHVSKF